MARIVEHREVSYYRDTQKLFGFYYEYMYHVSQIKTIQSSNFLWWGCKIVGQPDLFQCWNPVIQNTDVVAVIWGDKMNEITLNMEAQFNKTSYSFLHVRHFLLFSDGQQDLVSEQSELWVDQLKRLLSFMYF